MAFLMEKTNVSLKRGAKHKNIISDQCQNCILYR